MFRKIFASFMLAGAIALALSFYSAVGANAASEEFILKVRPGQYLVKLARAAGWKDEDYIKIVALNPKIWPEQELYHKSHNFVPVGLRLRVPKEVAVVLGLAPWTPAPAVVESVPGTPVAPVAPKVLAPPVWPGLVGLILGLAAFAAMAMAAAKFRLWDLFKPESVGQPVDEGGVRDANHAAGLLRSQASTPEIQLNTLRRVRIFGVIEVAGADGRFQTRVCAGHEAWEGRFADGRILYTLAACANPLRLGKGGRLLSGHVVPLEDVPVPAPVLQQVWNLTPTVLKQGPKGKLILEPVWRVPDPA